MAEPPAASPSDTQPPLQPIPQTGTVQINDDVEIGANSAIDRARLGRTWILKNIRKLYNRVKELEKKAN